MNDKAQSKEMKLLERYEKETIELIRTAERIHKTFTEELNAIRNMKHLVETYEMRKNKDANLCDHPEKQ